MAAEYLLPRLKRENSTEPVMNYLKRGRPSSPIFSSDPIFSTDDDEPSSENYIHERQKKKVRGPWFCFRSIMDQYHQANHDKPAIRKRTSMRRFDSGVCLGSDGSDQDVLSEPCEYRNPACFPINPHTSTSDSSLDLVNQKIQECLEEGNECIDLSSQGLTSLSNEAIKQLSCLIRVPTVTQGIFSALEPTLKIFLASNELTTLPCELFMLDHLQVLSLRGNMISDLPANIKNLSNLKELNLSQNDLKYLPFEILTLLSENGHLESLSLHPNLFYQPQLSLNNAKSRKFKNNFTSYISSCPTSICHTPKANVGEILNNRWIARFQVRTEVRFFDINGKMLKGPIFPAPTSHLGPHLLPIANDDYYPEPPPSRGDGLCRVPSLLETALAACAKTPQLPYLATHLPEDTPDYLFEILKLAISKKETGESTCTVCNRKFFIARTEWVEWWEISKAGNFKPNEPLIETDNRDNIERMVPLIRRGCSWLCVPRPYPLQQSSSC